MRSILVLVFTCLLATSSAHCATCLSLDEVTRDALRHTHDLRLSGLDVAISRASVREARADYFPVLDGRFNSQYVRDLSGSPSSQVTAVGETLIIENTVFQDSLSLNASYLLFDFGYRGARLAGARGEVSLRRAVYGKAVRDTKLRVLALYRDLLVRTTELASKRLLLGLYRELALVMERLFDAGLVSRVDVGDGMIRIVKLLDDIDRVDLALTTGLLDLSLLTGREYSRDGLEVSPLDTEEDLLEAGPDPERAWELRVCEMALEKKRAEIAALKREFLPRFSLYSNYILYSQDPHRLVAGVRGLRERSLYVGLAATVPLSEGLKTAARLERAHLEMERLRVEREKKRAEVESRYEKLRVEARILAHGVQNQQEMTQKSEENFAMTQRLAESRVVDYAELVKRSIELAVQRQEVTRAAILRSAALKELQILEEDGG